MKLGDLVKQRKTLCGGPSPVLLVIAISRDGESVRVLFCERFWRMKKERLEVISESR